MRLILTYILFFLTSTTFAQTATVDSNEVDTKVVKSFIAQLADPDIATDIILSQYLVIEEPSDEIYDYLEVSLEEIRINLLTKKIDDIEYIPYHKMARKEIKDIDLEGLDPNRVFFLYYKKSQMLALYLENGKVASFTLVANGQGKAHFVLY